MTPMKPWIAAKVAANSRAAKTTTCPSCGADVLAGLDADRCASSVMVDPDPIDALTESVALTAGRPTYDLVNAGGRLELDHRYIEKVAGPRRHPVVPAHVCGQPLPVDPNPPGRRHSPAAAAGYPDIPPF